uniref:Aldedh domain-containing protein n=1 Tax=Ascaris lumbricoides TaxID=6252 RepID=A0A0M3I603_ASCLU
MEEFFQNKEEVLGLEDEARVSDDANAAEIQLRKRLRKAQESIAQYKKYTSMLHAELGRFRVIGAAEDLDGQSEGVSHQHQRKEFFAEVDKKVAAAPFTLYTDISAVDERNCSPAMQFEPELAAKVHYAVAAAPKGALYNALKQVPLEWERDRVGYKAGVMKGHIGMIMIETAAGANILMGT